MAGSRAICSSVTREATLAIVGVTYAIVNPQSVTHPSPSVINHDIYFPPHLDLILPPPGTRTFQTPQLKIPTPPSSIEKPEILHDFSIPEVNLGVNELLYDIYNIVRNKTPRR